MYSEILSKVRTKREAVRLEEEVDLLSASLYKTGKGEYESVLKESVRSWVAEEIKGELERESISKADYLKGLKKRLSEIKTLRLTLAQEPTEGGLNMVQSWIRSNLGEGIISDINFNPRLIAGAVVIYNGKYTDLSLKNRFRTVLESKKKEIFNQLDKMSS